LTGDSADQLRAGARALRLDLSEAQIAGLLAYLQLIARWTKVYNLTAVRDPAEMVGHHLLDCLAVIPALRCELARQEALQPSLLDVGSGAGLPGVVLALCCPELRVCCVDAVAKKVAFVQQVAMALNVPNLRAQHARVEQLSERFDVVVSRAFASLPDFTRWTAAALAERGVWLAMKGKAPTQELADLPPTVDVFHVEQLQVPGLDAERCLVWMRPKQGAALG